MDKEEIKTAAVVVYYVIMPTVALCVSIGLGLLLGAWAGFFSMAVFALLFAIVMVAGLVKAKKDMEKGGEQR